MSVAFSLSQFTRMHALLWVTCPLSVRQPEATPSHDLHIGRTMKAADLKRLCEEHVFQRQYRKRDNWLKDRYGPAEYLIDRRKRCAV